MQRNKEIVRAMEDALNAHDLDAMAAFFAEDASNHGMRVGRAGFRAVVGDIIATFPDWHDHVEKVFADDDWVIEHVRATGTHLGKPHIPHNGDLRHVEPTGKIFDYYQIHLWRLRDGLIIEHEAVRDDLSLHRQLGVVPTPA
jgi:predicted ester cyclase